MYGSHLFDGALQFARDFFSDPTVQAHLQVNQAVSCFVFSFNPS